MFDPAGSDPAFQIHLSCSDQFTSGFSDGSSGLTPEENSNWQVERYNPNSFIQECGVGEEEVTNIASAYANEVAEVFSNEVSVIIMQSADGGLTDPAPPPTGDVADNIELFGEDVAGEWSYVDNDGVTQTVETDIIQTLDNGANTFISPDIPDGVTEVTFTVTTPDPLNLGGKDFTTIQPGDTKGGNGGGGPKGPKNK